MPLKPKAKARMSFGDSQRKSVRTPKFDVVPDEEAAEEAALEAEQSSAMLNINGDEVQSSVQKLLRISSFEPAHHYWLDLGNAYANAVFGSKEKGIPYGKVMAVSYTHLCYA